VVALAAALLVQVFGLAALVLLWSLMPGAGFDAGASPRGGEGHVNGSGIWRVSGGGGGRRCRRRVSGW
jgi:hypothetical protein